MNWIVALVVIFVVITLWDIERHLRRIADAIAPKAAAPKTERWYSPLQR